MSFETELAPPPSDGISALAFAPNANLLLASGWDNRVRLYDAVQHSLRASYTHSAAVLDCCFGPIEGTAFSAGLDKLIKQYDFKSSSETLVGFHDKPVKCVEYSSAVGCLISGSWDKTIKIWDHRTNQCSGTHTQPDKVYTIALSGTRLIVGTAGRYVTIWDLRNMSEPEQRRESSLKYQTRCIRAFPDGSGYALSSIEGRVAMEYFDADPAVQAQKYAFKCHRVNQKGVDTVYPVNALAFHPTYGTFASGGCDGVVNMWDGRHKKRLCQYQYPTSIAALAFNSTGSLLAVASSYTYEESEKDHPPDAIFVRTVTDQDVKPRPKVPA